MKDKRFDDMVVGKLHDYGSLVPPDMWERIKGHGKKRRFIAWWWLGGGLAAGIVIFYFLTTGKISNESKIVQNKETVYKNPSLPTQNQPRTKQVLHKRLNVSIIKTSSARPESINKYARINAESDNGFLHFNKPAEQQYVYRSAIFEDSALTNTLSQSDDTDDEELRPWFAEVFAGPLIGFYNADLNTSSWQEKRTENSGTSMHAGMMIGKYIGNRWTLKAGILYSSLSVKADRGIDSLSSFGTGLKKMIDIPLIGGYQVGNGKLKLSANAGIILNVLARYEDNNNKVTRKNIGLKSYSGVSVLYPIGEKLKVYIEPFYIHHFGNISRSKYFNQQIHEAGLSAGLRYSIDSRQHY